MARTRTTIRRIDPWSVLKFAFVANLVLLGVYLLVGAVAWSFVRRLQLVETVCSLAGQVGFEQCSVDGQALFDTMLVLGLLGVVIQTGVLVFLAFLANLIFDLVGGLAITLEDDAPITGVATGRRGVGSTTGQAARGARRSGTSGDTTGRLAPTSATGTPVGASSRGRGGASTGASTGVPDGSASGPATGAARTRADDADDELFGSR